MPNLNVLEVGSVVVKISRKPFQNKNKVAIVSTIGTMTIPEARDKVERNGPTKEVAAVTLEGCVGQVRADTLEIVTSETQMTKAS